MNNKVYRLLKWSNKEEMYPVTIQLHLTDLCNLNCSFCPTKSMVKNPYKKSEIPKIRIIELIEESKKLGVKEWHICGGGEPLYFKEKAQAIMESIKENGMKGELITNGTLFNEKIIKKLVEIGWDKINFSLDSPDEITNDILRSKGAFKKTIKAIEFFSEYKKKLKKQKPFIGLHTVLCNKNYNQIHDLIKLANKSGCQELLITSLNIWNSKTKKLELNKKQVEAAKNHLTKSKETANNLGIKTNLNDFLKQTFLENTSDMEKIYDSRKQKKSDHFSPYCLVPWFNLSIFADGTTQQCYLLKKSGLNCKKNCLKDIWNSKYFEEIRNESAEHTIREECKRCNSYNVMDNEKLNKYLSKYQNKTFLWDVIKCKTDQIADLKNKIKKLENLEIEINKIQNSISFKLGSKIGNTKLGKMVKKITKK